MRRSLIAAAALAVFAVLGACGGGDSQSASFNMTIGHVAPLTGYLSDFGPPGKTAADVAADQIDAAIDDVGADQTVAIKHEDDKTDPQAGVEAARKLVDDENASCLVATWAAAVTTRIADEVAIKQNVLQISPATTDDKITDLEDRGLVNRTAAPDSFEGAALADVMEVDLGGAQGNRVNIGTSNDAYGKDIARTFSKAWESKGGQVGKPVPYGAAQRSYDAEAKRIVSGSPDAFLIVAVVDAYQKLGPALVRTGAWEPTKTFVTDGLASSDLPKEVGLASTSGLRGTVLGAPNSGAAPEGFDELYTKAASSPRAPFDAQTFDAVILCYLAAVAAGSPNPAEMAGELRAVSGPGGKKYGWQQLPEAIKALQDGEDIDYEGASGPIDLDDKGDPTAAVYDLFRFKDGGADVFGEVPIAPNAN